MMILGADIGYSNLKVVHGPAGSAAPRAVMYPAGAIPLEQARTGLRGEKPQAAVMVNGAHGCWAVLRLA